MRKHLGLFGIANRFGVRTGTILRWVRRGLIPAPVKHRGVIAWPLEEIVEWEDRGCPRCPKA